MYVVRFASDRYLGRDSTQATFADARRFETASSAEDEASDWSAGSPVIAHVADEARRIPEDAWAEALRCHSAELSAAGILAE